MEKPKIPVNENQRIEKLYNYNILDTGFEKEYDEIVNLASYICETPIAIITLVDSKRQWFKAKVGIDASETPRDIAFCAHAINLDDILVINDTFEDSRFNDNPLVLNDPKIRFYAGAQLKSSTGHILGTLCAIDRKPRELTELQLNALRILSNQVIAQMELRKLNSELKTQSVNLDEQNNIKNKIFNIISHDLRSPFHSILGLTEILREDLHELSKDEIKDLSESIYETATDSFELVNNLLDWSLEHTELRVREKSHISVDTLVKKLLSVLGGVISKKGIKIKTEIKDSSKIYSDYNIIYSALQNILTNAIKFTPSGGEITISSHTENSSTMVKVRDTGIGLSSSEIENLLSPSGKSSTSGTNGEKGTGLGFAIAKDFIKMSGGLIEIESEKLNGTSVILKFSCN